MRSTFLLYSVMTVACWAEGHRGIISNRIKNFTSAVALFDMETVGDIVSEIPTDETVSTVRVNEARKVRREVGSENIEKKVDLVDSVFLDLLETNVTVTVGDTAFLKCRVSAASDLLVTWIRRRDWHILTTGLQVFTADARFTVRHIPPSQDWVLEIRFVQKSDEGTYECQIPTKTGAISHAFNVHVATPEAAIVGGGTYYADISSTVTLVCVVQHTPSPPEVMFWYHNRTLLEPSVNLGTSIRTDVAGGRSVSILNIHGVKEHHSGIYTCSAPKAKDGSTQLYVIRRHEAAAVQRAGTTHSKTSTFLATGVVTLLLLLHLFPLR